MIIARLQESTGRLKCVINVSTPMLKCRLNSGRPVLKGTLGVVANTIETYDGPYEMTPRVYSQMLETEGKQMLNNVTVYEIPVTRTSNPQGGLTVLIG